MISFTPINAAPWIGEEKGLFKKYGIDSRVILIGGASAGGVISLIAGDLQFLGGGATKLSALVKKLYGPVASSKEVIDLWAKKQNLA